MRQDRIDRTIPYKNIIMRCDRFIAPVNAAKLPQGFVCRMYRPGMERAWAELEHEIGDFACEQDALLYFQGSYMQDVDALQGRCIFVEEINSGAVIASCMAWEDSRGGKRAGSLHWLVTKPSFQRMGIGRALLARTMELFHQLRAYPIYLHTQPWSHKAVWLYHTAGFYLLSLHRLNIS